MSLVAGDRRDVDVIDERTLAPDAAGNFDLFAIGFEFIDYSVTDNLSFF